MTHEADSGKRKPFNRELLQTAVKMMRTILEMLDSQSLHLAAATLALAIDQVEHEIAK